MPNRIEQSTLFELTACDAFEPVHELTAGDASPSVTPKSDPSTPKSNVSSRESGVFGAVSPWAFCGGVRYVVFSRRTRQLLLGLLGSNTT
jgi:hypothetical protein